MIKIEFKEVLPTADYDGLISNNMFDLFEHMVITYKTEDCVLSRIKSVSFGCPSELVPSRAEILTQLGITEQEDELLQQQYKNV